jgi:hypothetical protein
VSEQLAWSTATASRADAHGRHLQQTPPPDDGKARHATVSWAAGRASASASAGVSYFSVGVRRTRRSSWAFAATTIVDTLISTAPIAGLNVIPAQASTPAASGIATTL